MLAFLLSLIGGLPAITRQIADAYAAKQNAQTDAERIAADVSIKTLEARRDVMVAESRSPWNQLMRAFLSIPAGVFLWKVIVFDKVLKLGTTDDLSPNLWATVTVVLGFYFLNEITERWRRR